MKTARVLNFGSLNLDFVYQVDHFVRPGETLSAASRAVKAGGKGLNQSVALARAGASVAHAGCIGEGGERLKAMLDAEGVDTAKLRRVGEMQGHTVIQVDPEGENCILLYGGSNRCVTPEQIRDALADCEAGDWLVLQNEINGLPEILEAAHRRGMVIALNPSPCDDRLGEADFGLLSWLMVNEIEAEQLTGTSEPETAWERLHARYPALSLLVTLGSAGSAAWQVTDGGVRCARQEAFPVRAVDTTGAGDTYTGYFIAGLTAGLPIETCMRRAARAASVCVTRPGAAASIPDLHECEE